MRRASLGPRGVLHHVVVSLLPVLLACSDSGGAEGGGPGGRATTETEPTTEGEDAVDPEDTVVEPVRRGSFGTVIPRPTSVAPADGEFALTRATAVAVDGAAAEPAVDLLREHLGRVAGLELPDTGERGDGAPPGGRVIHFTSEGAEDLGDEGYELRIEPDRVEVLAAGPDGFVWAVQTVRQLLPPAVEGGPVDGTFALPAGEIRDVPRLAWRGVMLDVARHFFPPDDVKRTIDIASAYKLNVLHLHLSDDQGWRLEIEGYPALTEIGASTEVGGGPGGFYTQDEYRDLVEYAAARGVTVVPEFDMPGHTNAALASIPELNCDGVAPELYTGTHVGFSSLCTTDERTYEFVDAVMGQVAELTPGPYLHIGGDESDATPPDEYRRFVERAAGIVRSHGKVPVGWDEIAVADLGPEAVAQHWRTAPHAFAAAEQGMSVVMSPAPRTYLDMRYDASSPFGNDWAGYIDTRTAFEWDPLSVVEGLPAEAVVGLEAPLWTELVTTQEEVELMLLPRLPGYAELGWSPDGGDGWERYSARLAGQAARWDAAGWRYTEDPVVPWSG